MRNLEQFKIKNQDWLEMIIHDYVKEMTWDEGMNSHASDYFNDTRFVVTEEFERLSIDDDELLNEVKNFIESEIITRLKSTI